MIRPIAADILPIDAPVAWPDVDHLDLAGAGSNCQGNNGEKFSFQAYIFTGFPYNSRIRWVTLNT
jgi:hypothetical protein